MDEILSLVARLERTLRDAERGRCDAADLIGPVYRLTGFCCGREAEFAGRTLADWCAAGHSVLGCPRRGTGLRYAAATGKSARADLRRARAVFAPLFAEAARVRRLEECECPA